MNLFELLNIEVPDVDAPVHVVGIDLGTTNSVVARATLRTGGVDVEVVDVDQPTLEGTYTDARVPSVLALRGDDAWIGRGAKDFLGGAGGFEPKLRANVFAEVKNEMGVKRTYHLAPVAYRSAAEVSGKILRFLREAEAGDRASRPARTVITVPASFQIPQREDTMKAADLAGVLVTGGDLLDEPVAAFLDHLATDGHDLVADLERPRTLVVFDFGGGTCDIAVLRIQKAPEGGLAAESLSVSRFHRLGGGDVDDAIVFDVLIPRLVAQNRLGEFELDYGTKRNVLAPRLKGVAEALKVKMSLEIGQRRKFGHGMQDEVAVSIPDTVALPLPHGRSLLLTKPSLTYGQFEAVLEPLLDPEGLAPVADEYRQMQSIFDPLEDALSRSGLEPEEVDYCLMVGGSSQLPPVQDAVGAFLPNARLLLRNDASEQSAIARGAALHALALHLTGRGLVRPVNHDPILLLTQQGPIEILPARAPLPFPLDPLQPEAAPITDLAIPESRQAGALELRVELVSGPGHHRVANAVWSIPAPVRKGERLLLERSMDENQVLRLHLRREADPEAEPFALTLENPLTHVVNPNELRVRVEELEESLRSGAVPANRRVAVVEKVAWLSRELGEHEKAISWFKAASKAAPTKRSYFLNEIGRTADRLRDYAQAESAYRKSAQLDEHAIGGLTNLAISQRRRGLAEEALDTVNEGLAREPADPILLVLRADLTKKLEQAGASAEAVAKALKAMPTVESQTTAQLSWSALLAKLARDAKLTAEVRAERKRREASRHPQDDAGVLPAMAD